MKFYSVISDLADTIRAAEAVAGQAQVGLGESVDLAMVFFTASHTHRAKEVSEIIQRKLNPKHLLGCSACGVIGEDREIDEGVGMSLLVASLPKAKMNAFHIDKDEWPAVLNDADLLKLRLGMKQGATALLGMGDPFTTPINPLLTALNGKCQGLPLIGGFASAGNSPGQNALLVNDEIHEDGFAGIWIAGVQMQTVVSQGCRPIGHHMIITRGKDNVIEQLGGRPALVVLRDLVNEIPPEDQELLNKGLFIGRAINEYQDTFGRHDFLVRNVIGANEDRGAIGVNDHIRVGQTVQFMVRDAESAHEDFAAMLDSAAASGRASGAVLFSCNGRGKNMFDTPCHDVRSTQEKLGRIPVAGMFAAGELGPVGGANFIHGHTASLAVFRDAK